MMNKHEQNKELHRKLWEMADKLRGEMDFNSYKEHLLPLIFLKAVSESNNSNKN